jgi:enamine deaminase RidA (YjgF/YER057c/UK114 family)
VERIVKLGVFVSSASGFIDQPKVANGASELMEQLFGDAGKHARSAVGVPVLPLARRLKSMPWWRSAPEPCLPQDWLTARPYAHRGLHGGGMIENSRAAFESAIAKGFGIELDVRPDPLRHAVRLP